MIDKKTVDECTNVAMNMLGLPPDKRPIMEAMICFTMLRQLDKVKAPDIPAHRIQPGTEGE